MADVAEDGRGQMTERERERKSSSGGGKPAAAARVKEKKKRGHIISGRKKNWTAKANRA